MKFNLKTIAIGAGGLFVGHQIYKRYFCKGDPNDGLPSTESGSASRAVRSYIADIDPGKLNERIIKAITVIAVDKQKVFQNMDILVQNLESHAVHINGLITERKNGEITAVEYKQKLITIIREIADASGIALKQQASFVNPGNYERMIEMDTLREQYGGTLPQSILRQLYKYRNPRPAST